MHDLDIGERVEADDVYVAESPRYVICGASIACPEEAQKIRRRVQGRLETINKRFKDWACCRQIVRGGNGLDKTKKHNALVRAVVAVVQLNIALGLDGLYELDYNDMA